MNFLVYVYFIDNSNLCSCLIKICTLGGFISQTFLISSLSRMVLEINLLSLSVFKVVLGWLCYFNSKAYENKSHFFRRLASYKKNDSIEGMIKSIYNFF